MNKNGIVFIVGLNLLVPVVNAVLMSIDTCWWPRIWDIKIYIHHRGGSRGPGALLKLEKI
jgi:hypothetical protein